MLELKNYNVFAGDTQILSNINAKFEPGIHVIMGSNGSGKSTLARSVMGHYDYNVTGESLIHGIETTAFAVWQRARLGLFVSSQHPVEMTGISNFMFIIRALQSQETEFNTPKLLKQFKDLCKKYSLPEDWHKRDLNVDGSGGEKKKNELIQIEMLKPDIVILDEPDSGLDIDSIFWVNDMITNIVHIFTGTVILITHYSSLIDELDESDVRSVTVLKDGKISETCKTIELAQEKLKYGFK